jgi:aspartate 1-decarboxylase
MLIELLKSKIHGAKITETELNYIGSITIDEALMDAANMLEFEKVLVVNNNNGERFETYIIKGERNSGVIGLNGAAARKGTVGDTLIIITFASMTPDEAKNHKPISVFPNDKNAL